MERHPSTRRSTETIPSPASTWLDEPVQAPAIFVINTAAYDHDGTIEGRWLDPTADPDQLREELQQLVGDTATPGRWAVIDQVGCGNTMLPETGSLEALQRQVQLEVHR